MKKNAKIEHVGVIISTYNNPVWLEKTLWGYLYQTRLADEIIIADDGSTDKTRQLIALFSDKLPLRHVWQKDEGFQKSRILNKALKFSTAEYLIFTDQDCIPRQDFIETHLRYAEEGYFLSGGYFRMPMSISLQLTQEEIQNGIAFSLSWLKEQGLSINFKCTKLIRNVCFSHIMNTITPAKATWNGCNSSGWRRDIMAINGYNEEMHYGGQDREFGERLSNLGIRSKQIRHSAIILHLDHKRPYKTKESIRKNKAIRQKTRQSRLVKTPYGIKQQEEEK